MGNITLLERPFRTSTLISTLEMALRSRQRLSDERFVSGHTVVRAVMDLAEIDKLVPKL